MLYLCLCAEADVPNLKMSGPIRAARAKKLEKPKPLRSFSSSDTCDSVSNDGM